MPKRNKRPKSQCCCEYIDHTGKQSHILACCCDCSALDSVCDRILECDKVPESTLADMFTTIEDRMRIPWFNGKGALKVNLDVALPVVTVPLGILIGTLHSALTILVLVFMPLTLFTVYRIWQRQKRKPRTKLFYSWGLTSVVQMYITFECVVISFREILLWENLLLNTLIILMLYAFYHAKKDPGVIRRTASQDMMDRYDRIHASEEKQQQHSHNNHSKHPGDNRGPVFGNQNLHEIKQQSVENEGGIYKVTANLADSESNFTNEGCEDKCCNNSGPKIGGPVGSFMMNSLGFSKELLEECVEDKKKREKELEHVIPSDYVSWIDSRMIQDGRVAMWCKSCRLVKPPRTGHCPVCNVCIRCRDHHCIWIDNCIGANNHRAFVCAVLLFVVSGCYGVHLTLTTLCTPVIYGDWMLFPSDCRFLYADFPTALCFVSCVYSICAVIGMSAVLLTQCILISQNLTSHEMHTASFRGWIRLGVCASHNSLTRGCVKNWTGFLHGNRKQEQKYGTLAHADCDCV